MASVKLSDIPNVVLSETIDRRSLIKRAAIFGSSVPILASLLVACGDDDGTSDGSGASDDSSANDSDEEPGDDLTENEDSEPTSDGTGNGGGSGEGQYGGTIQVALIGDPETLDLHQTSSLLPMYVSMHVAETLFTWDNEFQIMPDLVDTHEVSDDGLLNTLHLRQGVLFHNGDEFVAADARASIERWAELVGFGQQLMEQVSEIREIDDYTLEFEMTEPFGTFAVLLARQNNGCAIYPRSIVEEAGTGPISELIGTGPYRLVEHQPDVQILLERFEDFVPREDEPNGYAGRKYAYADQLRFIPVPDEAARIAGLQSGEYHFLQNVSTDHYETLDADQQVTVELAAPTETSICLFNTAHGLLTNHTLRRAIQTAVDVEPILQAMHGEGFYRANPSHMPEETVWFTTTGEARYNVADPDAAQELLDEAGYDGSTVRIITTQEYLHQYNQAVVLQQQLEDIGMTVDVQVYDWSTLLETRGDEGSWEIATSGMTFRVDPSQLPPMRCEWGGWWCTDEKVELVEQLFSEVEFDDRFDVWEQLQALTYEEVPYIKVGEGMVLLAYSAQLKNVGLIQLTPAFWNTWLEQ